MAVGIWIVFQNIKLAALIHSNSTQHLLHAQKAHTLKFGFWIQKVDKNTSGSCPLTERWSTTRRSRLRVDITDPVVEYDILKWRRRRSHVCVSLSQSMFYICRGSLTITTSHRRLLVVLGVQNLFSTHCTDSFLVSTALTVVRSSLMNRALADPADSKACFAVRIKPGFFRCQHLVLIYLTSSTLCRVPSSILPGVWSDYPAKLLLAFFTNHVSEFTSKQKENTE